MQGCLQQVDVRSEILIEIVILAEIHHENFVLRIAGANQVQDCIIDLLPLIAHGTGVVDYDADRYGNILPPERSYLLRFSLFENGERGLVQTRDQVLLVIEYRSVQHYLFYLLLENEHASLIVSGWFLSSRLRVVWCGLRRSRLRGRGLFCRRSVAGGGRRRRGR